ncbi:hypothetical protein DFH08DRAFT_820060 [Mycena albidolilacea]|uniref:Uncharacterized protein n=1 Tax=Mycena albidolilacea TaxID=1033008 RepID=A0AAD6ZCJ3_9AGAR|nr:hypothetical protein DFH08DRAFT_820060 [Mycena albidolilacea]
MAVHSLLSPITLLSCGRQWLRTGSLKSPKNINRNIFIQVGPAAAMISGLVSGETDRKAKFIPYVSSATQVAVLDGSVGSVEQYLVIDLQVVDKVGHGYNRGYRKVNPHPYPSNPYPARVGYKTRAGKPRFLNHPRVVQPVVQPVGFTCQDETEIKYIS